MAQHTHYAKIIEWQGPTEKEKNSRHKHKPAVDVMIEENIHKHICKCGAFCKKIQLKISM